MGILIESVEILNNNNNNKLRRDMLFSDIIAFRTEERREIN